MRDFIEKMEETLDEENNTSYTENGAKGYKTTNKLLLDLTFKIPELREAAISGVDIYEEYFKEAFYENSKLALKWLLYVRDIRKGLGERSIFRKLMVGLSNDEVFSEDPFKIIDFAEYGRWDDIIDIMWNTGMKNFQDWACDYIAKRLSKDYVNLEKGKPISLLAKWMPSENASSKETRAKARFFIKRWYYPNGANKYRADLTRFRKELRVVESKMSANQWGDIDYSAVPSKANLIYKNAFEKHDESRRQEYLNALENGETKINSSAIMLYEIVSKYRDVLRENFYNYDATDTTLEEMWKALPKPTAEFSDTLVVRDGSGSMESRISSSGKTTALDVADSICLYMAEHNSSPAFKNKFITFSRNPKIVDLTDCDSLVKKIKKISNYTDYSNTDIFKTFKLIRDAAVMTHTPNSELPKNVLIVSDMEFDSVRPPYNYIEGKFVRVEEEKLFTSIDKMFKEFGYEVPKLIFWNVNSSTGTIPVTKNKNGVILVSGFSRNIVDMVTSTELDPYKALLKVLNTDRYSCVDKMKI